MEESGADFQFIKVSRNLPEGCNVEDLGESLIVVQHSKIKVIETKLSRDYGSK